MLADEQLGLPLEDGLGVVAKRMDSRDLEQVILVANLQRETGGNTAEVLERVAETVRERGELRRLVASLTAQGRMSRWIVTALPILLLVLVTRAEPDLHGAPVRDHRWPAGARARRDAAARGVARDQANRGHPGVRGKQWS